MPASFGKVVVLSSALPKWMMQRHKAKASRDPLAKVEDDMSMMIMMRANLTLKKLPTDEGLAVGASSSLYSLNKCLRPDWEEACPRGASALLLGRGIELSLSHISTLSYSQAQSWKAGDKAIFSPFFRSVSRGKCPTPYLSKSSSALMSRRNRFRHRNDSNNGLRASKLLCHWCRQSSI